MKKKGVCGHTVNHYPNIEGYPFGRILHDCEKMVRVRDPVMWYDESLLEALR